MSEVPRCVHLNSALISSVADITLSTPNGHVNSATIPVAGINVVNKCYIDAVRANVTLVGYADTIATQLAAPQVLNAIIRITETSLAGIVLTTGTMVLLAANIGSALGVYTVVAPGILSQTLTVSPGNAVFVKSANQLYYCVSPTLILPWVAGENNTTIYPATANIDLLLANVTDTIVMAAGTYTISTQLTLSQSNTTLLAHGAILVLAAPLQICADNVTIVGATISGGGISATNCTNLQLRDMQISNSTCSVSGGTATISNVVAHGATNADANAAGFRIQNTQKCTLANCTAYDNRTGVAVTGAKNIVLAHCRIHDNTAAGIVVAASDTVIIADAAIYNNATGIDTTTSKNVTISGNITGNITGVISTDTSNILTGNVFANTAANIAGTITSNVLPAGSIQMFAGQVPPAGWMFCDGASISCSKFAALFAAIGPAFGTTSGYFSLPDLRQMFVRGFDARHDRAFGTVEPDEVRTHTHDVAGAGLAVSATSQHAPSINTYTSNSAELGIILPITNMAAVGGTETRPININLHYIIKY